MGAFYLFPRCGLDEALGFAIRLGRIGLQTWRKPGRLQAVRSCR